MTAAVLDASGALAWLLESQATAASDSLLRRTAEFEFVAPFVFDWEVQNILLGAGRAAPAFYRDLLERLEGLCVEVEPPFEVERVLSLAVRMQLSLFDAAYLQLALEHHLPIISRDKRLVEASMVAAVPVYDLR